MSEHNPEPGTAVNFPIGVLVMAYGGPNSLEEIPGYLADIRGGRSSPSSVVDEITRNYRSIGGRSPLLELTHQQMQGISAHFALDRFKFYLGMRHWAPWIEDTIQDMLDDGITHAVSIVMAPHYSQLSIARYHAKIVAGLQLFHGHIEFTHIESYHDAPGLIQAFARRVREGLSRWPEEERSGVHVVFSAHSLPERILEMGDPYDQQVRETARLVAAEAGLEDSQWSWSYQSAGRSPESWLGPQIQEHLQHLAQRSIRSVLSVPIGFVSDHVELLYDIDIQAREAARELGMRLERPPALNADSSFIKTVAGVIQGHLEDKGWL